MWKGISGWLYKVSRGWVALSALGIFMLFSALVLPDQADRAEMASGSAASPDTSLYYSAEDLYRMAEAYGEQGREAYVRARFTFCHQDDLVSGAVDISNLLWGCR